MKDYWISSIDEAKAREKLDKNEVVELLLMDNEDKQWVKAEVKLFRKPGKNTSTLKVFGHFGQTAEREYYIEPLNITPVEDE